MTTYGITRSELGELAPEIYNDFRNANGPFLAEHMPEHQVRGGFSNDSEYCIFLTLIASIDKRKETAGEEGLWNVGKRLWQNERWAYQPKKLIENYEYSNLIDLFTKTMTFNYYEDPHVWYLNSLTLYRHYDSDPMNLLEEADYDAPTLLNIVRKKRREQFLSLGGKKVGALWIRLLHEEIQPLSNIQEVDIPVDSHIRGITNKLLDADYSTAEVRKFWSDFCIEHDLIPVEIDQPLWLLDKYEDEWGEDYLRAKIETIYPST
ncbi:hypothetical protein [Halalkalicoccus sp. NIPERK01]|uniref:hypothetical protein n=1 Tax=Halalkalicoccus sp. NIPERK01 TaxID=3053469 RepID=UPI00256E9B88|nr:hypothetical protein [Halalkalicoccus sp. NIPERK01]MDL5360391.1 hypothetical protein [Halalkalicoccus sp. NIPERK01]